MPSVSSVTASVHVYVACVVCACVRALRCAVCAAAIGDDDVELSVPCSMRTSVD